VSGEERELMICTTYLLPDLTFIPLGVFSSSTSLKLDVVKCFTCCFLEVGTTKVAEPGEESEISLREVPCKC